MRHSRPSRASGVMALAAVLAVVLALFLPAPAVASATAADVSPADLSSVPASGGSVGTGIVQTADLSKFSAGNIISDAVFFDSSTMSAAQIQSFLDGKVPSCQSGYTCLKDYRQSTQSFAASQYCNGYAGAANETAATIIYKVAVSCGINPQVLLVTLQKEQGLVTHTWPSEWRYTSAMGQGCPDTAACDSKYYGFQNQVYGAARQFKIYAEGKYFTWYAPGKTWNVLYNPNSGCGTGPVYIQNKATAGLYYYTPYQPNAAALRAGYGEGDGCSSYGNRNFYQYFTDWFGSTQSIVTTLVRDDSDGGIYLISDTRRWHVTTLEAYNDLASVFGSFNGISAGTLARYTSAGDVSVAVLRDRVTGEMAYFQDGQRHRFASCDLVSAWGASCAGTVDIASDLFSTASQGAEMTSYFRVRGSGEWGLLTGGGASITLWNEAAARSMNGSRDSGVYAAYLPAAVYSSLKRSTMTYAAGSLVKAAESDRVYMTIAYDTLVWVPSWAAVSDYGRGPSDVITVPQKTLSAGYRVSPSSVQPTLTCDGSTYYPAGGVLHRVTAVATGLPTMTSPSSTCRAFPIGDDVTGTTMVKSVASSTVWAISGAARHQVLDWTSAVTVAGGPSPAIFTVDSATIAALPIGAAVGDGVVVKAGPAMLYLVSGTTLLPIPSYAIADEWGLDTRFVQVDDAAVAASTVGSPIGLWAQCAGKTLFAAGGRLAAATPAGFSASSLTDSACRRLTIAGDVASTVFVKSADRADVFVAMNGAYSHVTSWNRLIELAGGQTPAIRLVSGATVAALPKGPDV